MKSFLFFAAIILCTTWLTHSGSNVNESAQFVETKSRIHSAIELRDNAPIKSASINAVQPSPSAVQ